MLFLPLRWLKRRYQINLMSPRRRELERLLTEAWEQPIRLVSASTSQSYDEIYYASDHSKRLAVVRVNRPDSPLPDLIGPDAPGAPLDSSGRLNMEWETYSKLSQVNLSPKPLWRTDDAIACSWLPWDRASRYLVRHRDRFWEVMQCVIPAIRMMHDQGVTHLDMNLGNLLLNPDGKGVAFIDFEFGPVDWVSREQLMAFDYLRLIADCTKRRRGGDYLLADPERLLPLLDQNVEAEARLADMSFSLTQLHRLTEHPELQKSLSSVFRGL